LAKATEKAREVEVPSSDGLRVAYLARPVGSVATDSGLPPGARTVSIFLVNRRAPAPDEKKDEAFAFQVQLEVACEAVFLPRPDLRSHASKDWDDRVADLQYRDAGEFAVGHNVATEAVCPEGACSLVRTQWIPEAEVERVAPAAIPGVELSMDALSQLQDGAEAVTKLGPLVSEYRKWIDGEAGNVPGAPVKRRETGLELIQRARVAADRIQRGIDLLGDATCLEAFRLANKTMAEAARRRLGAIQGKRPEDVQPGWRPFQLVFILMNLPGIAEPGHPDRGIVDLLFFPTGGGKTEAYLGLAAFTLVLRRLRNPGIRSGGVDRADALHVEAADTRSTEPRRNADLRLGIGAAERRGKARRLAVRDRIVGRACRHTEPDGPQRRQRSGVGSLPNDPLPERRPQAIAHPARGVSLVRHEVHPALLPASSQLG
jgi:hypothetical protein